MLRVTDEYTIRDAEPKRRGRAPKYPFHQMRVGHSFRVPADDTGGKRVSQAIIRYRRKNGGAHFELREIDNHLRVFRVK